jgi:hypothetical protein
MVEGIEGSHLSQTGASQTGAWNRLRFHCRTRSALRLLRRDHPDCDQSLVASEAKAASGWQLFTKADLRISVSCL